jgi:hypothetical protein
MRKAGLAILITTAVIVWLAIPAGLMPTLGSDTPVDAQDTRARLAALARAKVFTKAQVPSASAPAQTWSPGPASAEASARLRRSPGEGESARLAEAPEARTRSDPPDADEINCRFLDTPVSGTTAKFDCALDDGSRLRVKYGSREVHAEVATTHLLSALGFGADDVSMARRVRCYGCPRWPMLARQAAERLHLEKFLESRIDYDRYSDFEWVSVERRDRYRRLEFGKQEGWSWHELSAIDPSLGGATHAEVDAFRLMALFLNHWDNKASNQRLVCPSLSVSEKHQSSDETPACDHPLAMMQDVGSTFGPRKVSLDGWSASPVWADASSCTISMKHLPYEGASFQDVSVSEEGRRLLSERLTTLTTSQLTALFTSARFDDVDGWVAAFERRVAQIAHRPPCPSTT